MDDRKINSFKERVVKASVEASKLYKKYFLDYEYIIFSDSLGTRGQKIKAEKGNFMHLIGINSKVKPVTFFEKCINDNLNASDFDFNKKYQSEKSVKGSVREKIKIISDAMRMFDKELSVEKNFVKNRVTCSFATSENTFTIGFVESGRPMTLMRNNQLDEQKRNNVDILLKKAEFINFIVLFMEPLI